MNPMSPVDVRRRGDSLRRRKSAIAAVGAAVAIAVIATPIALLSGGSGDQSDDVAGPSISQTPSAPSTPPTTGSAPLASIPDAFPLAAGYPDTNLDGSKVETSDKAAFEQVTLCGQTVWSPTVSAPTELRGVTYTGGEDFRARTLALYPNDAAAAKVLQTIAAGYEACPQESEGGTDQNYRVVSSDENSVVVAHTYGPAGEGLGVEIDQFIQVGNALLLDSSYGEFGSDEAGVQGAAQAGADASALVVDSLKSLIAGDGGTSVPPETGTVPLDEQNLLTIEDLPTPPDYATPWAEATDDTLTWECRPQGFGDLGADGSVAVRYQALTDDGSSNTRPTVRARDAVLQFPDPDAARDAYDKAVGYLESCEADQGYSTNGTADQSRTDSGASYLQGFVYADPETCGRDDCDAAWFDYQGVTQNGDRLVLVSYAQIGGPLAPDAIRRHAQSVADAAATLSGL